MHGYIYCCLQLDSRPITINLSTFPPPQNREQGPWDRCRHPSQLGRCSIHRKGRWRYHGSCQSSCELQSPGRWSAKEIAEADFVAGLIQNNSFKAVPGKPFQVAFCCVLLHQAGKCDKGFFTVSMSVSIISPIRKTFENFSYDKELPPWQVWCYPKFRRIWILRLLWGQLPTLAPPSFHPLFYPSHIASHMILVRMAPVWTGRAYTGSCMRGTFFLKKIGLPANHRTRLNSTPQSNRGKTLYLRALYILRAKGHGSMRGGAF